MISSSLVSKFLGYQRHFAHVVNEANTRQSFVRDTLIQLDAGEITHIHAPLAQRLVEFDEQRFIFGADGTERYECTVFEPPGPIPLPFVAINFQSSENS